MTEKKYRVHDWVKFQYSEIGEYIDENHTDSPLRNDEICDLLNELHEENQRLKSIEDGFEFSCTEKQGHFDKDKLYVKDTHTKIHLDGGNLFIEVYIPQTDEFYRFKYAITGKSLMREFTENYNPKGDVE